jgi:mannonate dehydratase
MVVVSGSLSILSRGFAPITVNEILKRGNSMHRREIIASLVAGAATASAKKKHSRRRSPQMRRVACVPRIKYIRVINTAPQRARLSVVKIITDQDELHGYGCASFTRRSDLISPAAEKYLKPLPAGRPVGRIEDIWQLCYNSSYWRGGPVLNVAIGGVDQALWDIKGRMVDMPVYEALGDKCREGADN